MSKDGMTAADLPTVVDCGHAPQPTFYSGEVTVQDAKGITRKIDATGRVSFPGYAVTPDGRKVCPDCADDEQREDMRGALRFTAYLSDDGRSVTTWTGGKLGSVTRITRNRRQTFVRVLDTHGHKWAGVGPAESGTYVSLRRVGVTD